MPDSTEHSRSRRDCACLPRPRPQEQCGPDRASLAGQRVLVVGLGRWGGGLAVTRWLVEQGATVTVTDRAEAAALADSMAALSDLDVVYHLGSHDLRDLEGANLVVVNPAVNKRTSGFFAELERRGSPWTTEINLFCQRCPAPVIGVTGTYGKSTTCAMLARALRACVEAGELSARRVYLGGNIGQSLLPELPSMTAEDLVVLELSSAQLEDLPRIQWTPALAVITNLSPQHLDRYETFEAYVAAKLNITRDPPGGSKVVVGELGPIANRLLGERLEGAAGRLVRVEPIVAELQLKVPGRHNLANAACVMTICRVLGANQATVASALESFTGLPHRLEFVRILDGVAYYDDSKATAAAAAVTALQSLAEPIVAIVGGQDKGVDLVVLATVLARECRVVVCVGESGPRIAAAVRQASVGASEPALHAADSLADAVRQASQAAQPGNVVLFCPGAPSFDAYANFEHRGRCFQQAVHAQKIA